MKKITLSAAIVALTMMGCSESGLDNSVASTSEITDAQNQYSADFVPALKKQSSPFICDNFGEQCFGFPKIDGKNYKFYISSKVSGNNGFGRIWIGSSNNSIVKADMLHIYTVCVRGCDDLGFCSEHSGVMEYHHSKTFLPPSSNGNYIQPHDLQCSVTSGNDVGTVSNYAAVLNAGKSDEIVMMGSTYTGLSSFNKALLVYQRYLAAPLQNH